VKSITNLPLLIVNTHGHPDHAGGNYQFSIVRANPADFGIIKNFSSKENRDNAVKQILINNPSFESIINKDTGNFKTPGLMMIKSGFTFNLGKRKLEVIDVPGHTSGSICLLDAENKLLFTGDNNNLLVWLFLENSLPLATYLQTLQNLMQRSRNSIFCCRDMVNQLIKNL